jgi:hypothetical protein
VLLSTILVALLLADVMLLLRRERYRGEIARLRSDMSEAERQRTDLLLASEERRSQVMIELIRRQARGDRNLHLAISVDSGVMRLQREGALLRDMRVRVGGAHALAPLPDTSQLAIPRGTRTIQTLLNGNYRWEVPRLAYSDRGEEPPADRTVAAALGPYAVVLSGGTVIYTLPQAGPLSDSTYILPASIRASEEDMRAIFPNLRAGMQVYFY